jgi:arginase
MKKIGAPYGRGGRNASCAQAPSRLIVGCELVEPGPQIPDRIEDWRQYSLQLAQVTRQNFGRPPLVIGGDHSVALGTWAGLRARLDQETALPMGMIWIDAHMDSHRPETSPSHNPHGMVLAALLGYGPKEVSQLLRGPPVLSAHHLTLIGVRSYEPEELSLLDGLGVHIVMMDLVRRDGLMPHLNAAVARAERGTCGWGLSLDLDVIDPGDMPAVSAPEAGGIRAQELMVALDQIPRDRLLAAEIVEYCSTCAPDPRSADLAVALIERLSGS